MRSHLLCKIAGMSESLRKIRWGVLGYARIARLEVIPALLRSGNSEFFGLASRDEAKLAEARATFPALARTCRDYDELLHDPEIDAVYIPLPNSLHREWTLKAAALGKHVLCEKPLALTAADVREMIAACEKHGVLFMEAFMYRYSDRMRQVEAVLRSGALGEIKFVTASHRFLLNRPDSIKLKPELGGGALYDVGCYPVNFAGFVADYMTGVPGSARPASVSVECVRRGGVDEIFSALLKYPSGLIASLHCGFNAQKRIAAEIIGAEGVLEVPDAFLGDAGSLVLTRGDERREIPVAASDRYRWEIEDFADAILAKRAPRLGLPESLRNAEVIDQLIAASR
jgi:predicted dehydrogenase